MKKFKCGDVVIFINKNNILFNEKGIVLSIEDDYICGQEIPNGAAIVNFYSFYGRQRVSVYDIVLEKLKTFI